MGRFGLIFSVWIFERLAQPVSSYPLSISVALIASLLLVFGQSNRFPWHVFAGATLFDLSSGLPFGVVTLATAIIYLALILGGQLFNFFDSLPLFLFSAILLSSAYWALIIWLGRVPPEVFSRSAVVIVIETLLILLVFKTCCEIT